MTYEALELEAVAVTADTIEHYQIHRLWCSAGATSAARAFGQKVGQPPLAIGTVENALGDWSSYRKISLADHMAARAACAAAWNRIAGIMTDQPKPPDVVVNGGATGIKVTADTPPTRIGTMTVSGAGSVGIDLGDDE